MADNTAQNGADIIATDEVATMNGAGSTGVKVQRLKVGYGDDGSYRDVSPAFPLPVRPLSDGSAVTSVAASASTTTLLAANANRIGASIHNDSGVDLYLACAAGASVTAFTVKLASQGYFEVPYGYTGIITGVWASATGNARITEFN